MRSNFRRMVVAAGALGAVVAVSGGASASPAIERALSDARAQSFPGESHTQYYGRRSYYRGGGGAGVAAGVIGGLAAGALIGGAIAGSQAAPAYGPGAYGPGAYGATGPGVPVGNVYGRDPNWVSYCASRYRSFDPVSGTFLGRDGYRYPCE